MKERIDKVLADRGLVTSRSQAKTLIEKGDVTSDGRVIKKASELIDPSANLEVASNFVGRGAFKLQKALEVFRPMISGKIFLDIGASTGGFTEVLLLEGASKVYAVDVGHGQLAQKLRDDPRVINLEGINIKDLSSLPDLAHGAVMDLSFISITKVLNQVHALLAPEAFLIVLIKPQFEAGLDRLPKDGVIKSDKVREEILSEVLHYATSNGWNHRQTMTSPIEGKSGNVEFLSFLTKV